MGGDGCVSVCGCVWSAAGGDGNVLGQVAGRDLCGCMGVLCFTVGLLYGNVEVWVPRRHDRH
jgi:hypothetical protein